MFTKSQTSWVELWILSCISTFKNKFVVLVLHCVYVSVCRYQSIISRPIFIKLCTNTVSFQIDSYYLLSPYCGRAMAQVVSRRHPTAEARVRSRVNPCGICGGQSGTVTGFPLSISFHWCSITMKRRKNNHHLHLHRVAQ
jgi:hypothetical protein